jgi:hypothetical protein
VKIGGVDIGVRQVSPFRKGVALYVLFMDSDEGKSGALKDGPSESVRFMFYLV